MSRTPLETMRQSYLPNLPTILRNLRHIDFSPEEVAAPGKEVQEAFPSTASQSLLRALAGEEKEAKPLQIGVVFSGGPAPGGHNVIAGVFDALTQLHPHSRVFGFLNGPAGLIQGNYKEITAKELSSYRNQGGFDLIGSGRSKIETLPQMDAIDEMAQKMQLDGLLIIGGDDSNTIAAFLAEYFKKKESPLRVIGIPKTIDGDLQNPSVAVSFGFDTASKTYAEMIGNIARDAASARKYTHFIKLMGRSASHVALECALATHPNLTWIGEEVKAEKWSLATITSQIADLIANRSELGKNYGVILVAEGLIEFIPEISSLIEELNKILAVESTLTIDQIKGKLSASALLCFRSLPEMIQKQLLLHRDPHGNVQVSLIETEKLLMETVSLELEKRRAEGTFQGKYSFQSHFLGYEGRAGFPSNFDCSYCYALGHVGALLIARGHTGYMAFVQGLTEPAEKWSVGGVPLASLLHLEMRKGKEQLVVQKALVDIQGKPFAYFRAHRKGWELEDDYQFPGPIQFYGDAALTDLPPYSLQLEE